MASPSPCRDRRRRGGCTKCPAAGRKRHPLPNRGSCSLFGPRHAPLVGSQRVRTERYGREFRIPARRHRARHPVGFRPQLAHRLRAGVSSRLWADRQPHHPCTGVRRGGMAPDAPLGRYQGARGGLQASPAEQRLHDAGHQRTPRPAGPFRGARLSLHHGSQQLGSHQGTRGLRCHDRRQLAGGLRESRPPLCQESPVSQQGGLSEDRQRGPLPLGVRGRTGDGVPIWRYYLQPRGPRRHLCGKIGDGPWTESLLERLDRHGERCHRRSLCQRRGQHRGQLAPQFELQGQGVAAARLLRPLLRGPLDDVPRIWMAGRPCRC